MQRVHAACTMSVDELDQRGPNGHGNPQGTRYMPNRYTTSNEASGTSTVERCSKYSTDIVHPCNSAALQTYNGDTGHTRDNELVNDDTPFPAVDQSKDTNIDSDDKSEDDDFLDSDSDDSVELPGLDTIPLNMPETGETKAVESYTADDVVDHNKRVGWNEWFIYGRKVYNASLIMPIVEERKTECTKRWRENNRHNPTTFLHHCDPMYTLKVLRVSRKDLAKILAVVRQGIRVDLPRSEQIKRLKHGVELVISELESYQKLTERLHDFHAQLTRWLANCSNMELQNQIPSSMSGNPNDAEFKLPEQIMSNPEPLRNWTTNWEEFDTEMPEEEAWHIRPFLNECLGDTHATFIDVLSERVDASLPEFELTIDGEAAWNVIATDLVSTDTTTQEQEAFIKTRANRRYFHNTERMRRRRYEIAQCLVKRHNRRHCQITFESFMGDCLQWADTLETGWKLFQLLCLMDAGST